MQNGQVMRPQMLRPGGPMPRPMIGGPGAARGVIQHSGLGGQGGYGGQVVGPQYGARPLVQQGGVRWGGQQPPGPPVQRMVRPGGPPQHLGPGGQMRPGQQYGMQQQQQQQGKDNIAYNVEHVFKDENGREVRKLLSQMSVQFSAKKSLFRCERCRWKLRVRRFGWSVSQVELGIDRLEKTFPEMTTLLVLSLMNTLYTHL